MHTNRHTHMRLPHTHTHTNTHIHTQVASSIVDLAFATMFLFNMFLIILVVLYPWLLIVAAPVLMAVSYLVLVYIPINFR